MMSSVQLWQLATVNQAAIIASAALQFAPAAALAGVDSASMLVSARIGQLEIVNDAAKRVGPVSPVDSHALFAALSHPAILALPRELIRLHRCGVLPAVPSLPHVANFGKQCAAAQLEASSISGKHARSLVQKLLYEPSFEPGSLDVVHRIATISAHARSLVESRSAVGGASMGSGEASVLVPEQFLASSTHPTAVARLAA